MREHQLPGLLTDTEREAFARDGYFVVPGALDHEIVQSLRSIADEHFATYRTTHPDASPHHILNEHDLVGRESQWLELIDWPTTFHKVWGLMGWNIQLFHTQLLVSPPTHPNARHGAYDWHQDNNRMNRDFETSHHPMVSLKVGYFLTDLPTSGMGNFCVVPRSHRLARGEFDRSSAEGVEVTARAGDAVVFDRRLWHSGSTNHSPVTRMFVTYGYSYRWLRPKSEMSLAHLYDAVTPVRRQLLGSATSANGRYDPQDEDVPLREWIRVNVGEDAVAR